MNGGKTIFKRIIDGEIPADVVYADERCMAFRDVSPQAPTHILVIPKKEIRSLAEVDDSDGDLLGHLLLTTKRIAFEQGLAENGYRVLMNTGADGGQTVPHLHIHLMGGRPMSWPPG